MNIGIFTDTYEPQINGIVTSIKNLKIELEKQGHTVYIFTGKDPKQIKDETIYRIPSVKFVFIPNMRFAYRYPPRLLMKIRKFKLDIVHTHTEFSLGFLGKLVAKANKIPLVHTYHTMYEEYVHYILNGYLFTPELTRKFIRLYCNGADYIICPAEKAKISLMEYGVKTPIDMIYTGLNFDTLKARSRDDILSLKKSLGILETDKVVVSVGRIAKEKSVDVVINSFAKLTEKMDNVKLVLVGDGPLLMEYKELVKELGISELVIFTSSINHENVGIYYQLGDIFVCASTSETQGLTYVEAMASKIPIVVKKDLSLIDIVKDGETGFFFEDNCEEVMQNALNNKELCDEIVKNSEEIVKKLSSTEFAMKVNEIYEKAISKYPKVRKKKLLNRRKITIRRKKRKFKNK